ncbi:MAG: GTPase domain-containing protein [Deltaproteobacteria bacterium]|nr:GTPase domain-containing protein [Deltaproteobacteria bacterium]
MSSVNLSTREITVKVVYYGPGLGGKTSSLQYLHRTLRPESRGQLLSLATGYDRTLYFDFLPVQLPKVKDFTIRMSLYTVPGQVHYNATRKLVLQGVDGVVFVADSQSVRRDANVESWQNLADNLRGHGMNPERVPTVLQYNKRDLPDVMAVSSLAGDLNGRKLQAYETCALTGQGIFEALKAISKLVVADLKQKGIFQDTPAPAPEQQQTPVVSSRIEESLAQHMASRPEGPDEEEPAEDAAAISNAPRFSELWPTGAAREPILAIENDIDRKQYREAVQRAAVWLTEYVAKAEGRGTSLAEALLMLGVHGPYYAKFREVTSHDQTSREDALFCLFFVTDIGARMRGLGWQRAGAAVDGALAR